MSAGKLIGNPKFYELEDKLLKECIPSEEVRRHLYGKLSSIVMAKLVCGAAIPLWRKQDFLRDICNSELDEKVRNALFTIVQDVSRAAAFVDQECATYESESGKYIYTLEECWYDYDILRHKDVLVGVFETLLSATDYIRNSEGEDLLDCTEEEKKEIWDALCWWELRVWEKTDDSNKKGLKEYGCFYFLHDEAMWFDRTLALLSPEREQEEEEYRKKIGPLFGTSYCLNSEFLKLPLPFQPGTVLEINPYPFGPKSEGILISYEDFNDEDVMVLTRTYEGKWCIVDVAGSLAPIRFKEQEDWISALYRLREIEAENEEDKRVFDFISGYIRNNPENAEKLLEQIGSREMTDQELWRNIGRHWCNVGVP